MPKLSFQLSLSTRKTHCLRDNTVPHAQNESGETVEPSAEQLRMTDALSTRSARLVDDIAARAGLSIATVQGVLGAMQLEGSAAERATGWVKVPAKNARTNATL